MGEMTRGEVKKISYERDFHSKVGYCQQRWKLYTLFQFGTRSEDNHGSDNVGKICFTTGTESVKAKNIERDS